MHWHPLIPALIWAVVTTSSASTRTSDYGSYGYGYGSGSGSGSGQGSCYAPQGTPLPNPFPLSIDFFPFTKAGSANNTSIAERARGIPPNYPLPTKLSKTSEIILRLGIQNGYFAISFLVQFLAYIINNEPGYAITDTQKRAYVIEALTAYTAQEEQHVLATLGLLQSIGAEPELPCQYFQVTAVKDYISGTAYGALFLETFSGFLQTSIESFGLNGDSSIIRGTASVAQVEAIQTGWYRSEAALSPSTSPFPTPVSLEYYYNILFQKIIVPGSCPDGSNIDLPLFDTLKIVQEPLECADVDQLIELSITSTTLSALDGCYVVYVNQQNSPVFVPIVEPRVEGGCVNFFAYWPCRLTTFSQGVTLVSVVNNPGPVPDVNSLAAFTKYGPSIVYK